MNHMTPMKLRAAFPIVAAIALCVAIYGGAAGQYQNRMVIDPGTASDLFYVWYPNPEDPSVLIRSEALPCVKNADGSVRRSKRTFKLPENWHTQEEYNVTAKNGGTFVQRNGTNPAGQPRWVGIPKGEPPGQH